MPFQQLIPRQFTQNSIRFYASPLPGIFGISNAQEWLLIASDDNIRDALLALLGDSNSVLMRRKPTGFVLEYCAGAPSLTRHKRLISEYSPVCNGRSSRYSQRPVLYRGNEEKGKPS